MGKRETSPLKQWLLTAVILILSLFSQQTCLAQERRIDPEIQRKIDDFIHNVYLPGSETTSVGLTIVKDDGEVLYTTGYGFSNREKEIPYENTTQVLLGSSSKSFTALLAVKHLHERFPEMGEEVLDIPIRTLLPQINFTLIDRFRSEQTTFRDLLAHRTCLFDQPLMAVPFDTTDEMVYRMRYNPETCGMRGDALYSNQMFVLIGWLTGIIAEKPYEEAMKDLWQEIGMLNTTFLQVTDDFTQMPYRAMPYFNRDNVIQPMNTDLIKRVKTSNAAGGIFSTSNEMARYMRFRLNLGSIDGKQIIPREVMSWLSKPSNRFPTLTLQRDSLLTPSQEEFDPTLYKEFGYGLGLFLSSYDSWLNPTHGGHYPPYMNHMSFFPAKNVGIFSNTHVGPDKWGLFGQYMLHITIWEILKGTENPTGKAMEVLRELNVKQAKKDRMAEEELQRSIRKVVGKVGSLENTVIEVGKYGSGHAGELELSERFNEQTNMTQYFIDYGSWYQGWLTKVDDEGSPIPNMYQIDWTTDVIQEDYAIGLPRNPHFAIISPETVTLYGTRGFVGTFILGLELDMLPVVPWDPDSC